jgi:Protein of unknown function, DUF547.
VRKAYLAVKVLILIVMHSAESAAQQGTTFDHSKFDTLLKTYVQNGKVNYAALKQDKRLDEYLQQLSEADPEALPTREEKIAFWINAYMPIHSSWW